MALLSVGVDDTATATHMSEGWAFILLPQTGVAELEKAAAPLSNNGAPFHGSKCGKRGIPRYENFLVAIRDVVKLHAPSLLAHVFHDPSSYKDIKDIAQTVVNASETPLASSVEAATKYVIPPLLTLQRLTSNQNLKSDLLKVWLDEAGLTEGFSSMNVGTTPPIRAINFAKALYNGYRKSKFPGAPEMDTDGLHVQPDEKSILIQAADVFGNFAAAYAACQLGGTDIRQLKGTVFGRVFGNPDMSQVLPFLSLKGDHLEVALDNPGVLQLLIT
jgi:hypothetical protein